MTEHESRSVRPTAAEQAGLEPWLEEDAAASMQAPSVATDADSEGRVVTIGWQVVFLPVLAVLAVAAGILLGRRYAVSGAAAGGVAPSVAPEPSGLVVDGREVRLFEMGELGDGMEVQVPGPGEGSEPAGSMPGVPPDQVLELAPSNHVLEGKPAPALEMAALADGGEVVKLADLGGQPVVVNFWATWCPPCRIEMPWLQSVYEKYAEEGLVVLAVDAGERVPPSDAPALIRRFAESMGLSFPVLYGENTYDVQREWTVIGLPATFLVARDGTVVDVHTGAYPNEPTLDAHVQRILSTSQ